LPLTLFTGCHQTPVSIAILFFRLFSVVVQPFTPMLADYIKTSWAWWAWDESDWEWEDPWDYKK